MKMSALRILKVEDLIHPILEEEDEEGKKAEGLTMTRTDTDTPAGKAIATAGGEGEVREKSGVSAPMISHLKKPEGHKDHRTPSVDTLKRLKKAGVDIKRVAPELFQ